MWVTTLQGHPWPLIQWGTVVGASLAASIWDCRTGRIPNLLTVPLFFLGLAQAAMLTGSSGLLDSLAAAFLLGLPYVLLFLLAGGGAGDAKLMAALGAWVGLVQGALVLLAVAGAGIASAAIYARVKGRLPELRATMVETGWAFLAPVVGVGSVRDLPAGMPDPAKGLKMPYGPAIFAGVIAAAAVRWLWWQ